MVDTLSVHRGRERKEYMTDAGQKTAGGPERIWTRPLVVFLGALVCCVLWGSASTTIKIAYQLFGIPPDDTSSRIMLAGARFLLAGMMTIASGSLLSRRLLFPGRDSWGMVGILALVQTVGQYYFFFTALAHTSGVRGTVINSSGNFLAILFAVGLFRSEKLTRRKLAGCVVGMVGIIILLGGQSALVSESSMTLAGEGAMLAASCFYAFSSCLIKNFSRRENPVTLSGYQFAAGGAALFLMGMCMGGKLNFASPACVWNLLYLGLISAGAYTLWGLLLKYNPVSRVSILGFMNPVMGVLLSALLLGEGTEAFSWNGLAALLLVSLGIVMVNSEHGAGKQQTPETKQ